MHASASLSAAPKDPYKVLDVGKDASAAEVKKKYFSLARKYHPDTNPDESAREKFVEIQDAYEVLKDEKKRASYDQYGSASQQQGFDPSSPFGGQGGFGGGFSGFGGGFGGGGGQSQSDLFDQLFGGAFQGQRRGRSSGFGGPVKGDTIQATVGVTFMEACKGALREVSITPVVECTPCTGTGLKKGAKRSTCGTCGGSGTRTFVVDGGFQMASTCSTCSGSGTTVPRGSQCGECSGMGKVRVRKTVKVDIPAGVQDGTVIQVSNAGDAPLSGKGPNGDLHIIVNVSASKVFRRQGPNLHHDSKIPWHTALLGGKVRVPTLDGDVDVRIPGGTQQGEEMVLKGRGVTQLHSKEKGDLFVSFTIQIPRSLTKRQRDILQLYVDELEGRSPAPSSRAPPSPKDNATVNDLPKTGEKTTTNDDNGTASFTSAPPLPEDGWLSRATKRLRGLIKPSGDRV
ncbi:hypothetical protein FIBSPDRAFT_722904 [Athelia psychrophila]|uniref:DnaJ homolog 1, mitochondrial n=1 Tax=Athelia psychrophila TaxID=1759441 RepID=A0A166V130_9AGAM|nr:hypothetical protein FIBSPDRAFT_722904 [Fibularhizoctonia sp. CBS 109695]